jgi:hypothetical protein
VIPDITSVGVYDSRSCFIVVLLIETLSHACSSDSVVLDRHSFSPDDRTQIQGTKANVQVHVVFF